LSLYGKPVFSIENRIVDKFAFILSDDFVNVKIYIDVCRHLCSFRLRVTFSISRAIFFFAVKRFILAPVAVVHFVSL